MLTMSGSTQRAGSIGNRDRATMVKPNEAILRLKHADLYVIKGRHKACGDFCGLLFGYGIGRILFTSSKSHSSVPPSLAPR